MTATSSLFPCILEACLYRNNPESSLPHLVVVKGKEKFFPRKIRPQGIGKIKLRIRSLPKQKIADAFFTARPNDEIRRGDTRRIKTGLKVFLGDVLRPDLRRLSPSRHG